MACWKEPKGIRAAKGRDLDSPKSPPQLFLMLEWNGPLALSTFLSHLNLWCDPLLVCQTWHLFAWIIYYPASKALNFSYHGMNYRLLTGCGTSATSEICRSLIEGGSFSIFNGSADTCRPCCHETTPSLLQQLRPGRFHLAADGVTLPEQGKVCTADISGVLGRLTRHGLSKSSTIVVIVQRFF